MIYCSNYIAKFRLINYEPYIYLPILLVVEIFKLSWNVLLSIIHFAMFSRKTVQKKKTNKLIIILDELLSTCTLFWWILSAQLTGNWSRKDKLFYKPHLGFLYNHKIQYHQLFRIQILKFIIFHFFHLNDTACVWDEGPS